MRNGKIANKGEIIMANEEKVIENSENWLVSLCGDKLSVQHKVGKQNALVAATLSPDVDTKSLQFKWELELLKAIVLSKEED